tara:strand:+ start:705 stop:1283 length:579 start_codon:yes stop_codon:yes gene_type:complete
MENIKKIHALNIKQTPIDKLDEDLKHYLEICFEKIGFIPNILLSYSWNQKKLRNFSKLYNEIMLGESKLSKLEKEMIALVVSSTNSCYYCQTAHGAAVRNYSKDPTLSEKLLMNYLNAKLSEKHLSMLNFCTKLTENPDQITENDRNKLRTAGFGDEEIWDICEVASFFNMTNRLASGIDILPNEQYHHQWR